MQSALHPVENVHDVHYRRLNEDKHDTNGLHSYYDASYDSNRDWFNATAFHANRVVNFSCPVYENICIYNQHFYVHDPADTFDIQWKEESDLLGANMPNLHVSAVNYKKFLHATAWQKAEYQHAHCVYHPIYTHLILEASYQTMLGEFYARTLRFLHYLQAQQSLISKDIQLWLLIGDQKALYVSHHLFTERFTQHKLQHFSLLFDHLACQCFHRILFCGFQRQGHEIPWPRKDRKGSMQRGDDILSKPARSDNNTQATQRRPSNHTNLLPLKTLISRMEPESARAIFPDMIVAYNEWVDAMDVNLAHDIREWKHAQIMAYYGAQEMDADALRHEIDEWRFIGLYDRKVRRSWLNIREHQSNCNRQYRAHRIFCHIIVLEDFLHSRDVIVIHRASFMLIGVHGAQLTDAIWMKYDDEKRAQNKYIVELLPYGGPKYTNSIEKPTALGVIFWDSLYNHVGLKLANDSMQNPRRRWDENDFFVKWHRLRKVIDFLIMDDDGMCAKYGRADKIQIPAEIDKMGFAVYNAVCIENATAIFHGVKPPRLY